MIYPCNIEELPIIEPGLTKNHTQPGIIILPSPLGQYLFIGYAYPNSQKFRHTYARSYLYDLKTNNITIMDPVLLSRATNNALVSGWKRLNEEISQSEKDKITEEITELTNA